VVDGLPGGAEENDNHIGLEASAVGGFETEGEDGAGVVGWEEEFSQSGLSLEGMVVSGGEVVGGEEEEEAEDKEGADDWAESHSGLVVEGSLLPLFKSAVGGLTGSGEEPVGGLYIASPALPCDEGGLGRRGEGLGPSAMGVPCS